jgi:hypothetical protein
LGVKEITGVDYHDGRILSIPQERFIKSDLTRLVSLPKHDLALSLEVAEHLPREAAEIFIRSLCALADVILFSAAIPSQGGTSHINEQWPDYWASLFQKQGFIPVDCVRAAFWDNPAVSGYYAQNAILYVKEPSKWSGLLDFPTFSMRRIVHPGMFEDQARELRQLRPLFTARGLVKRLPGALWNSVSARVRLFLDLMVG